MSHYMIVPKLSNRCYRLFLQLQERLNLRVTQSDSRDLYRKSEEKQFELLCSILDGILNGVGWVLICIEELLCFS